MNKVYVAIDGDNLFFLQRLIDWKIDFKKLRSYFEDYGSLVEVVYYMSLWEDRGVQKNNFIKLLSRFGYSIVTRPVKQIHQAGGTTRAKGSMDVRIALDAVLNVNKYDTFILISGDSDFDCLVDRLKILGKQVWVMASEDTISSELLEQVGQYYIDFNSKREILERDNGEGVSIDN